MERKKFRGTGTTVPVLFRIKNMNLLINKNIVQFC